jgi:hypothetical protein
MDNQKKHESRPVSQPPQTKKSGEQGATKSGDENEGEGSRSAARQYDAEAERAAKDPKRVEELAKKAKEALEGPEGDELRAAEARGKKGPKPV